MNFSYSGIKRPVTSIASIEAYKKYKVPRSILRRMLMEYFQFPSLFQDCLSYYNLKYWSPDYFFSLLKSGQIFTAGFAFHVIYYKCTPAELRSCPQVILSFRAAQPEYNLPAYVLIGVPKK